MRPLKLTIENFASFKGRQPALDLSRFDLFAIAGPTGSGKSSLLDAVVFALYGSIPRLGKGVSEMISLGRERAAVTLEFSSGARLFRVARVLQRGRVTSAQIDELTGGHTRELCDGVRAVDAQIEKLLGLSYKAFTQAVILPQGQFADFLKSEPKDRRRILSDLLRLGVYERMRRRAAEEAAQLKGLVSGLEQRALDFADATPERVAETRAALEACAPRRATLAADLDARQVRVALLRTRADAFRERAERRAQAARLHADAAQVEQERERLAAARRAAAVVPRLEAAGTAESRAAQEQQAREQAVVQAQRVRTQRETLGRALARARTAAAELPQLTARVGALDQIGALVAPRDEARRRRDQAQGELERRATERSAARRAESEAATATERREAECAATDEALAAVGYDAARHERLHELRDAATRLESARAAAERASAALRAAETLEHGAGSAHASSAAAADDAARRLAACARQREAAEVALRAGERRDAAMHLREGLHPGEPCPVCEQPVAHPPAPEPSARLAELRQAVERARDEEAGERRAEASAREAATRADAAWRQAQQAREHAAREAGEAARAVEQQAQALATALDTLAPAATRPRDDDGSSPELRLRRALDALGAQRARHEHALAARAQAQQALESARAAAAQAQQQARLLDERVADLERRRDEAEAEAAALQARIAAVTHEPDPAAERARVAARRDELQRALEQAEEHEHTAALEQAKREEALSQAERRVDEAARQARQARREARSAAHEAGFADEAAALEAQLATEEQQRAQERVERHDREKHSVEERLATLEAELQGLDFDAAVLPAEEQALGAARDAHESALREEERLKQRLEDLERRSAQGAALLRELDEKRRGFDVHRQLADDLRNERFQAYLLEEAFRELVAGASERLFELSARYTFAFEDDAFHVLDHDNARERRSAETLSGGETFLASLALALEMSQQVQRAAGAVHLDSLFIDEGFGTLDPETLETIAGAIESLNVGGRMVGIITHLPELTQRFQVRLQVEKRPEGSRVVVSEG